MLLPSPVRRTLLTLPRIFVASQRAAASSCVLSSTDCFGPILCIPWTWTCKACMGMGTQQPLEPTQPTGLFHLPVLASGRYDCLYTSCLSPRVLTSSRLAICDQGHRPHCHERIHHIVRDSGARVRVPPHKVAQHLDEPGLDLACEGGASGGQASTD